MNLGGLTAFPVGGRAGESIPDREEGEPAEVHMGPVDIGGEIAPSLRSSPQVRPQEE